MGLEVRIAGGGALLGLRDGLSGLFCGTSGVAAVFVVREHCAAFTGRAVRSLGNRQSTQNRYGQGESDCLIKTKHCDGR